jgi:hypothetical protein
MIELAMLSLIFIPSTPLQNRVTLLEIIWLGSSVKNPFHLVLENLVFTKNFFFYLLHFHQVD